MRIESWMVTPVGTGTCSPTSSARRNSAPPTSSDDPPPKPLSSATICGIAVILTVRAIQMPSADPTRTPAAITPYERIARSRRVTTIATSIPTPESRLPARAVAGLPRRRSPTMNRTAAAR